MTGWIKLNRKLLHSDLWVSEPFTRGQAWVDLLMLANHKDGFIRVSGKKVCLKRGQCGHSVMSLASRWKWSRGKVKRFLCELEAVQQIVQQTDTKTTIITICNYSLYQDKEEMDDTSDGTSDGTPNGQQTDTNKNDKKEKKLKKENKKKKVDRPDDVGEQVWSDWLDLRKKMKANVTETVLSAFRKESAKANMSLEDVLRECCLRGWRGFKAEWMQNIRAKQEQQKKDDYYENMVGYARRAVAKMEGRA